MRSPKRRNQESTRRAVVGIPKPRQIKEKQRTAHKHENDLKVSCRMSLSCTFNETQSYFHYFHSDFIRARQELGSPSQWWRKRSAKPASIVCGQGFESTHQA